MNTQNHAGTLVWYKLLRMVLWQIKTCETVRPKANMILESQYCRSMVLFNKIIHLIFTVPNQKWNTVSSRTQLCHYNLLVQATAHIVAMYVSPYWTATCFSWLPSSGSKQPNSLVYCCEV